MNSEHPKRALARPSDPASAQAMVEHSQYFSILLELDGTVIEVNRVVRDLYSPTNETPVGRPIWHSPVWLPENEPRLRRAVEQAALGQQVSYVTQLAGADRPLMTICFFINPIVDEQGAVVALLAEGHDMTTQQRIEDALERQSAFLQAVLDNITDGVAACDANGILTVFNEAARTFHNLRELPLPASAWAKHYDLYQPDGVTHLRPDEVPLYRAWQGEKMNDLEMVVAPPGEDVRRLLANGRSIVGKRGERLGAVVAMRDITQTRAAEDTLRQNEAHWRAMIQTLAEGVVQQDKQGRIVMANASAERIFGLTQVELLERDSFDARWHIIREDGTPFPGEAHPAMVALHTGKAEEGVVMGIYRPDGVLRWILVNSQFLKRSGASDPYGVISSFVDITALKQTEAQWRYAAQHDVLTGLPTAALFKTRLERAVSYAARTPGFLFAVLYIDLDGFKTVNDTLGHSIGDNLLVTVARQLERCVRSGDTVARLGGDEFALLSEDLAHTDDAVLLAERVLRDLAISLNVAGRQVSVSASVGVVVSDQHHVSDVLDVADAAMYRAKAAGKARYHLADKPTRKR
jgi:diguanylate cyclase (GGDEF)-like protein/PAS domain S-box-containing protein